MRSYEYVGILILTLENSMYHNHAKMAEIYIPYEQNLKKKFYFNPHFSFISSRYVLLSKLTFFLQRRGFKSFLFGTAGGIYCLVFKVRGDPKRRVPQKNNDVRQRQFKI